MGRIDEALARLHRIGGEELVQEMVGAFRDNAKRRIDTACEALRRGDLESLERAAHSLKASAGNVGATELVRPAAEIERLAAAGDSSQLPALVDQLPEIFRDVGARLDATTSERRDEVHRGG